MSEIQSRALADAGFLFKRECPRFVHRGKIERMTNPLHLIGKLIPDDGDLGDLARRFFGYVLVALFVLFVVGLFFLAVTGYFAPPSYRDRGVLIVPTVVVVPQASRDRIEYYRGLYDVCSAAGEAREYCVGFVQFAIVEQWYETESAGWNESDYKFK